jgi:hypothetical protein
LWPDEIATYFYSISKKAIAVRKNPYILHTSYTLADIRAHDVLFLTRVDDHHTVPQGVMYISWLFTYIAIKPGADQTTTPAL